MTRRLLFTTDCVAGADTRVGPGSKRSMSRTWFPLLLLHRSGANHISRTPPRRVQGFLMSLRLQKPIAKKDRNPCRHDSVAISCSCERCPTPDDFPPTNQEKQNTPRIAWFRTEHATRPLGYSRYVYLSPPQTQTGSAAPCTHPDG